MAAAAGENDFDLFVSYAHADDQDGWVAALVERIREEHAQLTLRQLGVFFDRDAIQTMDDWEHRILAGLKASKVMLAVLSPAYFQSPFCRREWEVFLDHELARTVPGEAIAPIYVVTAPGLEDGQAALDQWIADLRKRQYLDLRPWWPEGKAALEQEEVRLKLQALEEQVAKRLEAAETIEASPSTVPEHNRNFVGREEELRSLRRMLIDGRVGAITAVHGVGGIGKSALAFEYAHAFAAEYPGGRFMVSVAGATDLRIPIINLASKLEIELTDDEKKDLAAGFARVRARLEEGEPSLLLLDNLDDPALLTPARRGECLPHGRNVHVLATTRIGPQQLPGLDCLALDRLSDEDGLRLLEKYRPPEGDEEWKAALEIVRRLGGHALAVEVVAVYLVQNADIPYTGFLTRLEEEGLGALDAAGVDPLVDLKRHPVKLLGPLLEPTLAALSAAETCVLEYASLLPPDRIAISWLRELAGKEFAELTAEPKPGYPNPWQRLIRRLDGLRLLIRGDDERLARMHRIVQDVLSARMDPQSRNQRRSRLVAHAEDRGIFLVEGWVDRGNRWEIAPVRNYAELLMDAGNADGAFLASYLVHALIPLGNLSEARELMLQAIAVEEKVFEADHPDLAISYNDLALIEQGLGNLAEARELILRAIAIDKKVFQADHPTLAIRYNNLATIEQGLGNLAEARELMHKVIVIHEKALEPDHPTIAIGYSNLARIEQDLGNLPEARKWILRAIAINKKALEPDHPDLATSYCDLALIEQDLGNLPEARELVCRAIEIDEKIFEPDHPTLGKNYSNLAMIERELGNLPEARARMLRAIAIEEKAFEPDHPNLATGYNNLAQVEKKLGNLPEARKLMLRVIEIQEKAFEPDHPKLAASYSNLATVACDLGNPAEARSLALRAIEIDEKAFEPDHPRLAEDHNNLAMIERELDNLTEARARMLRAIAIWEKAFEPDHPTLATSYSNLALIERDLGNLAVAREGKLRAIAIYEKALEPDHPDLATSYGDLALIEQDLGNLAEARKLMHRAIAIDEKVFQPDHPMLAIRYNNLATIEKDLGNLAETRELMHKVIVSHEKALEPDHLTLATTYNDLAMVEQDLGNLAEARELMRKAIEIWEGALETDSPDLATGYHNLARIEQDLGSLAEARELMRRAIATREKVMGADHPTLSTGYYDLALIERDLDNFIDARELMLRAIAIEEKVLEADHPDLATEYWHLATIEQDLGNLAEARELMRQAFHIYQARLGDEHQYTQDSRQWLEEFDPEFGGGD